MKKRTYYYRALSALFLIIACLAAIIWYFWLPRRYATGQKEQWMTVMVHGSFGTTLGLFSVFNVIKGNVENTHYKKMTSHMRHDPFFYQLQPLLSPGLHPITPTFTPPNEEYKPAVLPVTAAYQELTEHIRPNKEQQHFYTMGWSGLISQERRRKESLRFYNMLTKEYKALLAKGITPKIRLITHSHGGNVLLNMAGIDELLETNVEPTKKQFPDDDQRASMTALHEVLSKAKEEEAIAHLPHQKKWDYQPEKAPFVIDELILLGTPVQPETSSFFLSPFFKKIYHFYSEDDVIQGMDWVSTRRYYSEQRIPCLPAGADGPEVIQAKITLNKPGTVIKKEPQAQEQEKGSAEKQSSSISVANILSDTAATLWSGLFGKKKEKALPDPNHKELWFMGWKKREGAHAQNFIQPYPFAVFVPLLQHLMGQQPDKKDFDLRLKFKDEAIDMISYGHDDEKKQKKLRLPQQLFKTLQEHIKPWQPANVEPSHEMNILHRYSKMLDV